jgi:hypothetical protein
MRSFFDSGIARMNPWFLRITSMTLIIPNAIDSTAAPTKSTRENPLAWTTAKRPMPDNK